MAAYANEIPWLHSTLADLLVLHGFSRLHALRAVQANRFTLDWPEEARLLAKKLGLRVWRAGRSPSACILGAALQLELGAVHHRPRPHLAANVEAIRFCEPR